MDTASRCTVNTPRLQVRDTAEVRMESGKSAFLLLVPYGLLRCMYGLARCVMQFKHGRLDPAVSRIHAGYGKRVLITQPDTQTNDVGTQIVSSHTTDVGRETDVSSLSLERGCYERGKT